VGNIFSLSGDVYSLAGSNTSYILYDNNVSNMSLKANTIELLTNNLLIGDNTYDTKVQSSNVVMNVLNSFGLKVNASNVLLLDTSGNTTLGNKQSQTLINSSGLVLSSSTLQATVNNQNILSVDNQNRTTLGNSTGTVTLQGTTFTCNASLSVTNLSSTNLSATNASITYHASENSYIKTLFVGEILNIGTSAPYITSGSGGGSTNPNTSYIFYPFAICSS
jgi:hypothetical protein